MIFLLFGFSLFTGAIELVRYLSDCFLRLSPRKSGNDKSSTNNLTTEQRSFFFEIQGTTGVFVLFLLSEDEQTEEANDCKLHPGIIVHDDGHHTDIGQNALDLSDKVLLSQPFHILVIDTIAIITCIVITLCQHVGIIDITTRKLKQNNNKIVKQKLSN